MDQSLGGGWNGVLELANREDHLTDQVVASLVTMLKKLFYSSLMLRQAKLDRFTRAIFFKVV